MIHQEDNAQDFREVDGSSGDITFVADDVNDVKIHQKAIFALVWLMSQLLVFPHDLLLPNRGLHQSQLASLCGGAVVVIRYERAENDPHATAFCACKVDEQTSRVVDRLL